MYGYKTLSSRTKINVVDNLMKPIFEDFLGLKHTGAIQDILTELGVTDVPDLYPAILGQISAELAVETLSDLNKKVDNAVEHLYTERVSPFVFYVGSTGLVPDEFHTRAQTAEQIKAKYPDLSLGKNVADATFYEIGGGSLTGTGVTLISVFTKAEVFSTGKFPLPDADADASL